jgi:hypothetical protein
MSHIYTVTFHPPPDGSWLASARHHDRRFALAEMAIDSISGEQPALIAMPAGFLRASNLEARDRLAELMRQLSRRAGISLVFGIDVAPDGEWAPLAGTDASFAYACDNGVPVLWPATQVRASTKHPPKRPREERKVPLAARTVGIVIGSEAFNAPLRLWFAQEKPSLILVLAHSPPTDRWSGAVSSLMAIAPTFVVAPTATESANAKEPWVLAAPRRWERDLVAETTDMTIRRYHDDCPLCEVPHEEEPMAESG